MSRVFIINQCRIESIFLGFREQLYITFRHSIALKCLTSILIPYNVLNNKSYIFTGILYKATDFLIKFEKLLNNSVLYQQFLYH